MSDASEHLAPVSYLPWATPVEPVPERSASPADGVPSAEGADPDDEPRRAAASRAGRSRFGDPSDASRRADRRRARFAVVADDPDETGARARCAHRPAGRIAAPSFRAVGRRGPFGARGARPRRSRDRGVDRALRALRLPRRCAPGRTARARERRAPRPWQRCDPAGARPPRCRRHRGPRRRRRTRSRGRAPQRPRGRRAAGATAAPGSTGRPPSAGSPRSSSGAAIRATSCARR